MSRVKLWTKFSAVLMVVAVFCTACDVPDLSEFTKQSAEMTRGIRKGARDTESLLKSASERDDLYSVATRTKLKKELRTYQTDIKPTLTSLDALDGYLEALNALAQANKKSEENSRAIVTSLGNLVSAVSGLTFAGMGVNVATGLLTVFEQFRTSRDFKKRVNLAGEIVEGRYAPKRNAEGRMVLDAKGQPILVKSCTGEAREQVTQSGQEIRSLYADIIEGAHLNEAQTNTLKALTPEERRERLRRWGKITPEEYLQFRAAESNIASFGCGVIDLIKFNVEDLKEINLALSQSIFRNASENKRTTLGYYKALNASDIRVQRELEAILKYQELVGLIRELEANDGAAEEILKDKVRLKTDLDALFILDGELRNSISDAIAKCGANCGRMRWFVNFQMCEACAPHIVAILKEENISKEQFDRSNGVIERILETRAASLGKRNSRFLDDLERITPAHAAAIAELKQIQDKQNALDEMFESSISALDTWAQTHANLRVAVNTKKPLDVAKLASKVREIWAILEPNKTGS
jgi:hypothetical protein